MIFYIVLFRVFYDVVRFGLRCIFLFLVISVLNICLVMFELGVMLWKCGLSEVMLFDNLIISVDVGWVCVVIGVSVESVVVKYSVVIRFVVCSRCRIGMMIF